MNVQKHTAKSKMSTNNKFKTFRKLRDSSAVMILVEYDSLGKRRIRKIFRVQVHFFVRLYERKNL